MSVYQGYVVDSQLNVDTGNPAITVTVANNIINSYSLPAIAVNQPFGYIGQPLDGSTCYYSSFGDGYGTLFVHGYSNAQWNDSLLNDNPINKGETVLYNAYGFSQQMKQDGIYSVFQGASDVIMSKIINGENTTQILADICNEIKALEQAFNDFVQNTYNTHIHPTPSGNSSVPTIPVLEPYEPTDSFTTDSNFLGDDGSKNLVDNNGQVLS